MLFAAASNLSRITTFLSEYLGIRNVWDVFRIIIDIIVVSYAFYTLITLLRGSRAFQFIKGVILILVAAFVANILELSTVSYVLKLVIEVLPVMLIVVFHPEIRRVLESIGKSQLRDIFSATRQKTTDISVMVEEVVKASEAMAEEKTGALIIFERETNLSDIIRTGTVVDSAVSAQFLRLLFIKNTPLHDGAVIIRGTRICAAACYLPLSDNLSLNKDLGTRHRAGIGISETTDCVSIIVSEETGYISIARNGVLTRNISPDVMRKLLRESLAPKDDGKKSVGKGVNVVRRLKKHVQNNTDGEQENKSRKTNDINETHEINREDDGNGKA